MTMPVLLHVADYRVRLPSDLFPYKGKQVIEVRHVNDLKPKSGEWLPITASSVFQSAFDKRNRLNVPGTFYGAETDTCETGPMEAPANVLMDHVGQEFISRQPCNEKELRDVFSAALCECFIGYGADGDDHWTLRLIRDWWWSRSDMIAQADTCSGSPETINTWKRLLAGEAEQYLRAYAFLVEEGRIPDETDHLPEMG